MKFIIEVLHWILEITNHLINTTKSVLLTVGQKLREHLQIKHHIHCEISHFNTNQLLFRKYILLCNSICDPKHWPLTCKVCLFLNSEYCVIIQIYTTEIKILIFTIRQVLHLKPKELTLLVINVQKFCKISPIRKIHMTAK